MEGNLFSLCTKNKPSDECLTNWLRLLAWHMFFKPSVTSPFLLFHSSFLLLRWCLLSRLNGLSVSEASVSLSLSVLAVSSSLRLKCFPEGSIKAHTLMITSWQSAAPIRAASLFLIWWRSALKTPPDQKHINIHHMDITVLTLNTHTHTPRTCSLKTHHQTERVFSGVFSSGRWLHRSVKALKWSLIKIPTKKEKVRERDFSSALCE